MLRAKDVMQTRITRVGADDPLVSIHRLFCDEEISGAPVISETGEVLGVVTIRDLLKERRETIDNPDRNTPPAIDFFRDELVLDHPLQRAAAGDLFDRLTEETASDVMSPEVISVEPEAPVSEVAEKILENRIHRVLVLDPAQESGALVGIISVFDLVQVLA